MILIRSRSWVQTWQWTFCYGWRNSIVSPRNTLHVTACTDQPSQTRQPSLRHRLMAVAPGELELDRGFPSLLRVNVSKLCAPPACHGEYGATLVCNLQTVLSFPLGSVSLYFSSPPLRAALTSQPNNLQRTLSSIWVSVWVCTDFMTDY